MDTSSSFSIYEFGGMQMVYRTKYRLDGSVLKHKACLFTKGFHQTLGVDFHDTFSPNIKASTIRVIFSLAVTYGWDIQQVDINHAFLNGDLLEDFYMVQPPGFVNTKYPHHI
ncbi:hypothetical protein LWI28_017370 [Acer negundo]|uniref:Reverse transcriptase Ty1/copia-type domain-containing protein n=1 Tax=Acer negundo TaxID=4023 RepID=A0AAD5I7B7_ACENE|nr:hypothetical protein LWI28_017370 [Acer negundo]